MRGQAGFFDLDERLKELSAKGDTLEVITHPLRRVGFADSLPGWAAASLSV